MNDGSLWSMFSNSISQTPGKRRPFTPKPFPARKNSHVNDGIAPSKSAYENIEPKFVAKRQTFISANDMKRGVPPPPPQPAVRNSTLPQMASVDFINDIENEGDPFSEVQNDNEESSLDCYNEISNEICPVSISSSVLQGIASHSSALNMNGNPAALIRLSI